MKKFAIVAAAALMVGGTGEARAQDWFWGGAYSMALPMSKTKDFNEGLSFRGITVEGRKLMSRNRPPRSGPALAAESRQRLKRAEPELHAFQSW